MNASLIATLIDRHRPIIGIKNVPSIDLSAVDTEVSPRITTMS